MGQLTAFLTLVVMAWAVASGDAYQTSASAEISLAQNLIGQQRYDDAIERLQQMIEQGSNTAEARTYTATARLYRDRDYLKGKDYFAEAFGAGGGASLMVNHSHEVTAMSTDELTDYCRGWIHLRKGEVSFTPQSGDHAFKFSASQIAEFKQNRQKRLFHLKVGDKNFNFSPRSRNEGEVLLLVILYDKFVR